VKPGAGIEVLDEALAEIASAGLDKAAALGQLEATG
jgi:tRNA-dihydrouridine synthase A